MHIRRRRMDIRRRRMDISRHRMDITRRRMDIRRSRMPPGITLAQETRCLSCLLLQRPPQHMVSSRHSSSAGEDEDPSLRLSAAAVNLVLIKNFNRVNQPFTLRRILSTLGGAIVIV